MKLKLAGAGLVLAAAGTAAAIAIAATTITPITVAPKDSAGTITIGDFHGGDTSGAPPINVLSFSWGIANSAGGTGPATLHDLTVTKLIDKASPTLFLACATGRHIQQVTLVLNRPGAPASTPFMTYRLGDVLVTSDNHSGSGSDRPTETVSFSYATIDQTYTTSDGETVESSFQSAP